MNPQASLPSWPQRVGWLVLIWTTSVLALAFLAFAFRLLMNIAGLTA
jgi:hypothetical protein